MPIPKLPKTVARLSTSVTIRLISEDNLDAAALSDPAVLLASVANAPIGAVESFEESNARPAGIRFEMNASRPGVVLEAYPNQVEARTLEISRVVLYENDVTEAFSIDAGDIVHQWKAFAIIKVEKSPDEVNVADRITVYRGCWLTTNPKAYNVSGGELKIVQDVSVTYSEREVVAVNP